jgi:hypothetical protein
MRNCLVALIVLISACHPKLATPAPYAMLSQISVEGKVQTPIYDAQGKTDSLIVFRINETGEYLAAVAFQDSNIVDHSELYLFRVKDSSLEPLHFRTDSVSNDFLVAYDNFSLVDTANRAIYCETGRDNDDTLGIVISKYVWEADSGRWSLSGRKSFGSPSLDQPASVIKAF